MIDTVKRGCKTYQGPLGFGSLARKGHAATWRAKNLTGFLLFVVRARVDIANEPCRGCTHVPMRLLTSWRENLLGVSQEQGKLGDGRLANVNGALEIEPRPYGCSSPSGWLEKVGITFLACPIPKAKFVLVEII